MSNVLIMDNDGELDIAKEAKAYIVLIRKNGEHDIADVEGPTSWTWALEKRWEIIESTPPALSMYTWAKDEEHALEIVEEKRQEIGWYEEEE